MENAQGEIFRCNLRRTLSSLVVGDKVIWRQGNEQLQGVSGVIEAIHPRQNEIARPDYYDGPETDCGQYRSYYYCFCGCASTFTQYYRCVI